MSKRKKKPVMCRFKGCNKEASPYVIFKNKGKKIPLCFKHGTYVASKMTPSGLEDVVEVPL